MIRFVDLTAAYWGGDEDNVRENPCCAFLNTVNDRFVALEGGMHVFDFDADLDLIEDLTIRWRCRRLVPAGFWAGR